jgi:hypothetical protein
MSGWIVTREFDVGRGDTVRGQSYQPRTFILQETGPVSAGGFSAITSIPFNTNARA